MSQITAILLMGGTGTRFGTQPPKQFQLLQGKPLYCHTLAQCLAVQRFAEILLVCHEHWIAPVSKEIALHFPSAPIRIVAGGPSRQASSFLGLQACQPTDFVLIHDAVRPFVSARILQDNINAVIQYKAVDTCIPSTDTLVEVNGSQQISHIPNRTFWWRGQTPQSFAFSLIYEAHLQAQSRGLTNISDDCRLVLELGHPIHVVLGDEKNLKITTPLDLFLAEQLLQNGALLEQKRLVS